MGVQSTHKESFAKNSHAPIVSAATDANIFRNLIIKTPIFAPSSGIDSNHIARCFGDKHNAVDHERNSFRAVNYGYLISPFHLELANVAAIYRVELTVSLRGV